MKWAWGLILGILYYVCKELIPFNLQEVVVISSDEDPQLHSVESVVDLSDGTRCTPSKVGWLRVRVRTVMKWYGLNTRHSVLFVELIPLPYVDLSDELDGTRCTPSKVAKHQSTRLYKYNDIIHSVMQDHGKSHIRSRNVSRSDGGQPSTSGGITGYTLPYRGPDLAPSSSDESVAAKQPKRSRILSRSKVSKDDN